MSLIDPEEETVRTPTSLGPNKVIFLTINSNGNGGTVKSVKLEFTVLDQDGNEIATRRPVITSRLLADFPQKAATASQFADWLWGQVELEVFG